MVIGLILIRRSSAWLGQKVRCIPFKSWWIPVFCSATAVSPLVIAQDRELDQTANTSLKHGSVNPLFGHPRHLEGVEGRFGPLGGK